MRRELRTGTAVAALAVALALTVNAGAAVPPLINFQGRLLDQSGAPEVGILSVGFALYATDSGGTTLWSETQTIAFADGFYSVMLGSVSPLPVSVLTDPLWLSVTVGGTELLPRMQVASVVFALRASVADSLLSSATGTGSGLDADSVDGLDATDFASAGHTHAPGDADTLDGIDASGFAPATHNHDPAYVNASGDTVSGNLGVTGSLTVGGDNVWDEGNLRFTLCTYTWTNPASGYHDYTFTAADCTDGVPTGSCMAAMRRAECGNAMPMIESRCNNNGSFHHYRPTTSGWCVGSCLYICQ